MLPVVHVPLAGIHVVVATHAVLVLLALVAGTLLAVRCARRPDVVLAGAPVVAIAGLAGAALLFRAVHGWSGLAWTAGMSSMGGLAAGLVAVALLAVHHRVSFAALLDAYAPGALLALAVGRVGCFLGGCCAGRPTDLPWGVVFPELGPEPRHPLQLSAAAADLGLVWWLVRRGGRPGAMATRACIGLGVVRFALEMLRDASAKDPVAGGVLSLAQVGALALVAGGLATAWSPRTVRVPV
jgi:phosphatidylglycerol:prolipoprotein diacylglycerol transferase